LIDSAAEKIVDWAHECISRKLPENSAGKVIIWELL